MNAIFNKMPIESFQSPLFSVEANRNYVSGRSVCVKSCRRFSNIPDTNLIFESIKVNDGRMSYFQQISWFSDSEIGNFYNIYISDLPSKDFYLVKAILIRLEAIDGEYMASVEGTEISISEATAAGAVSSLKSYIVDVYRMLKQAPKLGPAMMEQLRFLEQRIVESSQHLAKRCKSDSQEAWG